MYALPLELLSLKWRLIGLNIPKEQNKSRNARLHINLDHLGFFNLHLKLSTQAVLHFIPVRMCPGFEQVPTRWAAECCSHNATAVSTEMVSRKKSWLISQTLLHRWWKKKKTFRHISLWQRYRVYLHSQWNPNYYTPFRPEWTTYTLHPLRQPSPFLRCTSLLHESI